MKNSVAMMAMRNTTVIPEMIAARTTLEGFFPGFEGACDGMWLAGASIGVEGCCKGGRSGEGAGVGGGSTGGGCTGVGCTGVGCTGVGETGVGGGCTGGWA